MAALPNAMMISIGHRNPTNRTGVRAHAHIHPTTLQPPTTTAISQHLTPPPRQIQTNQKPTNQQTQRNILLQ